MQETVGEVVVIGAGAAGLMAAIRSAERGRRTLLLEKNRRPGIKILMSGGTRCNITHATDNRGIVEAFGRPGRFLHSALAALSVQDTIDFFESERVATKVEETGKIFPVSNKAADVLDALVHRLHRSGATVCLEESLQGLRAIESGFAVQSSRRLFQAEKVVLTTGGQSYPGSGTTGDGYRIAAQLGHTIVAPRPALVPLSVQTPWVGELRGVTLPDVLARINDGDATLASRRGSLLFAHFGLTGPVILDVSRVASGHPCVSRLQLQLDLLPDRKSDQLDEHLRAEFLSSGKKQLAVILAALVPRRLAEVILIECGLQPDRKSVV